MLHYLRDVPSFKASFSADYAEQHSDWPIVAP